ncbi:MAG TPA: chorismate mutase [Bacillota bacterium]|jgi:chorismate mutase
MDQGPTAVRGAISVEANEAEAIASAARKLAATVLRENRLETNDIVAAIFTATPDLDAAYPAAALRGRAEGWDDVPLMCLAEMPVRGSLPRCLRLLLICRGHFQAKPVYLEEATALRPDLAGSGASR